jgi:ubiquinone/menaquinone biosynthesis C-methylase UbiE
MFEQMPDDIIGLRADASRLPPCDKVVDLSMSWELIHHIIESAGVFREMRRVTRKLVILFKPNRWNLLQAGFSLAVSKERLGLRNTRIYLTNMIQRAGLNIVHYATVGCIFPNKCPVWLARILGEVPFKIPYVGISHLLIAEVG